MISFLSLSSGEALCRVKQDLEIEGVLLSADTYVRLEKKLESYDADDLSTEEIEDIEHDIVLKEAIKIGNTYHYDQVVLTGYFEGSEFGSVESAFGALIPLKGVMYLTDLDSVQLVKDFFEFIALVPTLAPLVRSPSGLVPSGLRL